MTNDQQRHDDQSDERDAIEYVKSPETAAMLTRARLALNLSLENLADYLGIGGRTVRRWEAGTSQMPTSVLDELAELRDTAQQIEDELADLAPAHITLGPETDNESFGEAWPQYSERISSRTFWVIADRVSDRTGMTIGRGRRYVHPDHDCQEGTSDDR